MEKSKIYDLEQKETSFAHTRKSSKAQENQVNKEAQTPVKLCQQRRPVL